MKHLFGLIIMLLSALVTQAGTLTVQGTAPDYKGEIIKLFQYDDLLTERLSIIDNTIVDEEDGSFAFTVEIDEIQPLLLRIGTVNCRFYGTPDKDYQLTFMSLPEDVPMLINYSNYVPPKFEGLDTTDINYLTVDFDYRFRNFMQRHAYDIAQKRGKDYVLSFAQKLDTVYANVENPYFLEYYNYSVASLKFMVNISKKKVYEAHLKGRKVNYHQPVFFEFIETFFENAVQEIYFWRGAEVVEKAIAKDQNVDLLFEAMDKSDFLKEDEQLKELVMIVGLRDLYYENTFKLQDVEKLILQISKKGKYEENRNIASNLYEKIIKNRKGYPAPNIAMKTLKGDDFDLEELKGKMVYIQFFASWCKPCLKELFVMKDVYEEYYPMVEFVSISIDDHEADAKAFADQYNIPWTVIHQGYDDELRYLYDVLSVPAYFLLDEEGKFMKSYTPTPEENIERIFRRIKSDREEEMKREKNKDFIKE